MDMTLTLSVVELRRYVMQPGRRDDLIDLFEHAFIEPQEQCGMTVVGHYRDLDDPQSFVWFRGFPAMQTRRAALEAFYVHSPAWLDNREAANATIADSDNVLLLRPARPDSGFDLSGLRRDSDADSCVGAAIVMLAGAPDAAAIEAFERETLDALRVDAQRVAYFVTEERPNDFPRLPVRESEWAFVVTGICPTPSALQRWTDCLRRHLPAELHGRAIGTEYLRLEPAGRSLYR